MDPYMFLHKINAACMMAGYPDTRPAEFRRKNLKMVLKFTFFTSIFISFHLSDVLQTHRSVNGRTSYAREMAVCRSNVNFFSSYFWAFLFPFERLVYLALPRVISYIL